MDAEGVRTEILTDESQTCGFNRYTFQRVCVDADFNRDGKVDNWRIRNGLLEISYSSGNWFATHIPVGDESVPKLASDFNGDGFVDFDDFASGFLPAFGSSLSSPGFIGDLDADGDGNVDFNDFALGFLPNFGKSR